MLNFRVRYGNGCDHLVISTRKFTGFYIVQYYTLILTLSITFSWSQNFRFVPSELNNVSLEDFEVLTLIYRLKRSTLEYLFFFGSNPRPISTNQLNTLLYLHSWPINHVVYMGSYPYGGISHLEVGFTLRCLQRLSLPNLATQLCHWYDNWCTRGSSIPVLSY